MLSKELEFTLNVAFREAREKRHEFMTVEHLLLALIDNPTAAKVLRACGAQLEKLKQEIAEYIDENTPMLPEKDDHRMPRREGVTVEEIFTLRHPVTLDPEGSFARLAGADEVLVNSLHGQGIDRVADALAVEAVSSDGVIEGVRLKDDPGFTVGVQWHAEWKPEDHPLSGALYRAFGEAAAERAALLSEVETEWRAQIRRVRELCGEREVAALDGHEHIHMLPFLFEVAVRLAREHGIPELRICREAPFVSPHPGDSLSLGFGVNVVKHLVLRACSGPARRMVGANGLRAPAGVVGLLYTGRMTEAAARADALTGATGRDTVADVYAGYAAGDAACVAAVERAAVSLGRALANVITVFGPEVIVIGGGPATKGGETVIDPIRRATFANVTLVPHDRVRIVCAALGSEAGAVGAALAARSAVGGD